MQKKTASSATAARNVRHKWAAALAAYLFRLKPEVWAQLEARRQRMWPAAVGGQRPEGGWAGGCAACCRASEPSSPADARGQVCVCVCVCV